MNNLKLKNKIFLILLIPIVTILILSFISISNNYEKKVRMNESLEYLYFSQNISSLIHDLQKERNLATLFLESYGKKYAEDLKKKIKKGNENYESLNKFFEKLSFDENEESKKKLLEYKQFNKLIQEIREKNQNLQISKSELNKTYNLQIANLTYFIDELITYSNVGNLSKYSQSYIAFNQLIEKTFNEKEFIRNILNSGNILGSDYNQFINSVAEQNLYIETINNNILKKDYEAFTSMFLTKDFVEVENLRKIIFLKSQKNDFILKIKELSGYGGLIHFYKE